MLIARVVDTRGGALSLDDWAQLLDRSVNSVRSSLENSLWDILNPSSLLFFAGYTNAQRVQNIGGVVFIHDLTIDGTLSRL